MGFTLAWCLVGDVSRRLCSRGFNGWCLVVGAFKVKKLSCVGFFVLVPARVLSLLVDGVVSSMAPACLELQAIPLCLLRSRHSGFCTLDESIATVQIGVRCWLLLTV